MSDMDDIRRVAAQHLQWRGRQAAPWLIEQAEIAEAMGDYEAAKTRREVAAAAETMLREGLS